MHFSMMAHVRRQTLVIATGLVLVNGIAVRAQDRSEQTSSTASPVDANAPLTLTLQDALARARAINPQSWKLKILNCSTGNN